MQQRKSKKILIYLFLLFLVGSINNINFNNLKFKEIENINVLGLGNYDNSILISQIKNLNLKTLKQLQFQKQMLLSFFGLIN